jgi:hypothetical protein
MTTAAHPPRQRRRTRDDQRLAALSYANHVRTWRRIYRQRAESSPQVETITMAMTAILHPPMELMTAEVEWVLLRVRGIGPSHVTQMCRRANVRQRRKVGDLSGRQREALAEVLTLFKAGRS